jgi:hypothetical protein
LGVNQTDILHDVTSDYMSLERDKNGETKTDRRKRKKSKKYPETKVKRERGFFVLSIKSVGYVLRGFIKNVLRRQLKFSSEYSSMIISQKFEKLQFYSRLHKL